MNVSFCGGVVRPIQFTSELQTTYILLCAVNGFLSIFSTISNGLVVVAIGKASSLHSLPTFVLIFTLAMSDLGVGMVTQPLYIAARTAELRNSVYNYCSISMAYRMAVVCLSGLSFLIMTAMSFDRLFAICLCMKYRSVVTRKRTIITVLILATTAVIWAVTAFLSQTVPYYLSLFLMPLCIFVTSLNYLNINRMLKKQREKFQDMGTKNRRQNRSKNDAIDFDRYKRVLDTMLLIYIAFLACYVPYLVYLAVARSVGHTLATHTARHVTTSIIFLNSGLNPVLYLWRIPEVRKAVKLVVFKKKMNATLISYNNKKNFDVVSISVR